MYLNKPDHSRLLLTQSRYVLSRTKLLFIVFWSRLLHIIHAVTGMPRTSPYIWEARPFAPLSVSPNLCSASEGLHYISKTIQARRWIPQYEQRRISPLIKRRSIVLPMRCTKKDTLLGVLFGAAHCWFCFIHNQIIALNEPGHCRNVSPQQAFPFIVPAPPDFPPEVLRCTIPSLQTIWQPRD